MELTVSPNPRKRIKDWRALLEKIEQVRLANDVSIEEACLHVGIAYSTYYQWKKRLEKK